MKECKSCGEEMKDKAKRCPHCGALIPKEKRKWIVLSLFSVGCILGGLCDFLAIRILQAQIGPAPETLTPYLEAIFSEPIMWLVFGPFLAVFGVVIYLDSTKPKQI